MLGLKVGKPLGNGLVEGKSLDTLVGPGEGFRVGELLGTSLGISEGTWLGISLQGQAKDEN